MLKSTFIHIPGVGAKTEREIWSKDILSWDSFLENPSRISIPNKKKETISRYLDLSYDALRRKDAGFFARALPKRDWWRIYPEFKEKTAFIDIETTGLSLVYDEITLIGLYDGRNVKIFIKDQNLEDFRKEIQKYSLIVTFNGTLFDLKFIEHKQLFEGIKKPPVHIDLRFLLRRLNYRGKLKTVEKKLGITRKEEISKINGLTAATLWNHYIHHGREESLKTLIKYNVADITSLKNLMDFSYQNMKSLLLTNHTDNIGIGRNLPEINISIQRYRNILGHILPSRNEKHEKLKIVIGDNKPLLINPLRNRFKGITLRDILTEIEKNEPIPKVVGIDLCSRNGKKKTGWAYLHKDTVETRLLETDNEIIKRTVECAPDLISIDAPLSLPKNKESIMRECEIELRRRGIFIFPCLLRSMELLTNRGIFLKNEFVKRRYTTIESYPGVAQDILGITRKKVSVQELKQGLIDFGLNGDFKNHEVTHDELDAITSALVGYFYKASSGHMKYHEEIGNPEEGYLVIPSKVSLKSSEQNL